MSDYPMLISNKLHSFRNFEKQITGKQFHPSCLIGYSKRFRFISPGLFSTCIRGIGTADEYVISR